MLVNGVQVSGFGFLPIVGQKALSVCLQGWCGWQTFQWTAPALHQDHCVGNLQQAMFSRQCSAGNVQQAITAKMTGILPTYSAGSVQLGAACCEENDLLCQKVAIQVAMHNSQV